jgi:hypothetical protein
MFLFGGGVRFLDTVLREPLQCAFNATALDIMAIPKIMVLY